MKRRTGFNPKRSIRPNIDEDYLQGLAESIKYGGNPEHKRNPGDFGLTPPAQPRPYKSLCDVVEVFSKLDATRLLRQGVKRGLISDREQNGFPQNIWSVTKNGYPLEAQLENAEQGIYHGYPMPQSDPFREKVLEVWQ
jgi:hypothetical protein